MVVVLIRAILPGKVLRGAAIVGTVVLVLVNLYQALLPTYRLDSATPYRQIADDVVAASAAEGIETVMASDNSLNVESIFRYMRQHVASRGIRLLTVTDAELVRRAAELGGRPFLFISHMGGGGPFVDIHQLGEREPQLLRGYVSLRDCLTTISGSDDTRSGPVSPMRSTFGSSADARATILRMRFTWMLSMNMGLIRGRCTQREGR